METAAFKLSPAEQQLIRAFRKLDDEGQRFTLGTTNALAKDPMFVRKPALRVIAGGKAQ